MEQLDTRRAQVLIEMTLVAMTFNDSFSLGVELANKESHGSLQSLLFTSFGLSEIDIPSGIRTFHPGGGFNGLILGPEETPVLFRAIAARGDSRVITTPKIVVAGNTTATISNVEEAPFTSVNASDTVATTSFAGFESAGTTLTVTPRAAEGEYVILDYSFNFSNFNGQGSVGVPPPRSTNSFSGSVEVPDGYTVVVGGMVTENETDAVTEFPLLGRLPGIGALFQQADRTRMKSRVFAFIRTTVLRDDEFEDLKFISARELERAELLNDDFPPTSFLWME
jgi:general secretion pathway protein D